MRGGVAGGTSVLRALRKSDRRAGDTAKQPGSRTRKTSGYFVDGVLSAAGIGWSDGALVRATGDREAGCYSEWAATGNLSVAATVSGSDRLADFAEGGGRLFHRLGIAATGRMGKSIGAGDGIPGSIECPDRYGARSLHAMGITASRIGKRI